MIAAPASASRATSGFGTWVLIPEIEWAAAMLRSPTATTGIRRCRTAPRRTGCPALTSPSTQTKQLLPGGLLPQTLHERRARIANTGVTRGLPDYTEIPQ